MTAPDAAERDALMVKFREFQESRAPALRDELVTAHLGLAEYLARRFDHRGEPLDDLIQVASLALVKAVERFDVERGLEFSTFAVPTIVGELKRHFRDKSWAIRVPRRIQELHLRMGTIVQELTMDLGRSPTVGEIALRAEVGEEDVIEAMEAGNAYRGSSLDAPSAQTASSDEGGSLGERLGGDDEGMEQVEHRTTVERLLATLPEREREIVRLRFFDGLTQSEIAARIGISQMHVSRLLARSLSALRTRVDLADANEPASPTAALG